MIKKHLKGFAALGAGISMLIGIGVSHGIGIATGSALEGIARNPTEVETIVRTLILGNFLTLLPFFAAFIVALCLLLITIRCFCTDSNLTRELAALSAGIAVLGGIGAGLGLGTATGFAVEAIATNPSIASTIIQVLLLGSFFYIYSYNRSHYHSYMAHLYCKESIYSK